VRFERERERERERDILGVKNAIQKRVQILLPMLNEHYEVRATRGSLTH
jgi:hypothetical protein